VPAHPDFVDFDGDGRSDVLVFRPSDGYFSKWYSGATRDPDFLYQQGRHVGGSPGALPDAQLLIGDFDGDGRSDVLVFRPSDGYFSKWYSGATRDPDFLYQQGRYLGGSPGALPDAQLLTGGWRPPLLTVVTTGRATDIGLDRARLTGAINPKGQRASYAFEYRRDTGYGTRIPPAGANVGPDWTLHQVAENIHSLQPDTAYHFRLLARVGQRSVFGTDASFRTPAAPREAMEWHVPPVPVPKPNDPTPAQLGSGQMLTAGAQAAAPVPRSGAAVAAAWRSGCPQGPGPPGSCCAGGDRYPNNCAHFLSNAFIAAGYTELRTYGARCPTGRPIRAREMWQWFQQQVTTYRGRTSKVLQQGTGWWAVFQLDEKAYWGGHVAFFDADAWVYYGTGWYGTWDQHLYAW
jgi:hypothetical protein